VSVGVYTQVAFGGNCWGRVVCVWSRGKLGNSSSSSATANRSHQEEEEEQQPVETTESRRGVSGSDESTASTSNAQRTVSAPHHLPVISSPPQRVFSEDTHSLERQVAEHRRTRETSGDSFGTPHHSRRGFAEVFRRLRVKSEEKQGTPRSSPRTNHDRLLSGERGRPLDKRNHRTTTSRHTNSEELSSNNEAHPKAREASRCLKEEEEDGRRRRKLMEGPKPPPPPPLVPESTAVYELVSEDEKEDICPTCLEPYTEENPKITAKCGHTFHLSCIYEWLERSQYCPVCASIMEFQEN